MKSRLARLFGVSPKGWPSLPNSRRQLLVAGLMCLGIWPGIGLVLLLTDQLDANAYMYAIVSPYLLVTVLGVYLIGQSLLARNDRPRFRKPQQRLKNNKEQQE